MKKTCPRCGYAKLHKNEGALIKKGSIYSCPNCGLHGIFCKV